MNHQRKLTGTWELGRLRGSELGDKAETRVWLGVARATGLCSEF